MNQNKWIEVESEVIKLMNRSTAEMQAFMKTIDELRALQDKHESDKDMTLYLQTSQPVSVAMEEMLQTVELMNDYV